MELIIATKEEINQIVSKEIIDLINKNNNCVLVLVPHQKEFTNY